MSESMILTVVLLLPGLGVLALALLPSGSKEMLRLTALAATTLTFLASIPLWTGFEAASGAMQFTAEAPWFTLGTFQARYAVGIDGISLFLVLLTNLIMPLCILASWHVEKHLKGYLISMLALQVGMVGVFIALDLVLFYLFWEVMLIPMYFLIGIWGGERRIYAAVKFFLYTAAGSLLMLAALITLYFKVGSLNIVELTQALSSGAVFLDETTAFWLFSAFFLAFAIKVPLFPFHTWLPDAHVEAPTAGSVILAGVLLKMGTYGLLRFCLPMFPEAAVQAAPTVSWLAIIAIIYGALVAMVQPDVKKLVAYSSVSHMGLIVLGIFAFNMQAVEGATMQMLNHGISTGGLFLLVGMIYDRRHTRKIEDFGGLAQSMPVYAVLFMVITLSSIGLPGLNGFVGEFLTLQGTFLANPLYAAFATTGVILSAVYMLWMYQRVFLGKVSSSENRTLSDLSPREIGLLLPLVILALWMGLYSSSFLRPMDASIQKIVDRVEDVRQNQDMRVENRGN
ncbi:MAG TPA: NADH-quinone oxidoreductase subunit M [Acidobacteriota bacterium]|nr:NADH-quinone oxidoreductase subunit M [Acidobacteriota bacterium]